MKQTVAAFILLFSLISQANTVESTFKIDSPIPQDLKVMILDKLSKTCSNAVVENGLTEVQTEVSKVKIDQGQIDYYFTTTFTAVHEAGQFEIVVQSADLAIYNPIDARYQVLSIWIDVGTCY
ncbi:MAG: hypothetical protein ACXWC9_03580 [Pseudobdellovibrionaceae bacterium]